MVPLGGGLDVISVTQVEGGCDLWSGGIDLHVAVWSAAVVVGRVTLMVSLRLLLVHRGPHLNLALFSQTYSFYIAQQRKSTKECYDGKKEGQFFATKSS